MRQFEVVKKKHQGQWYQATSDFLKKPGRKSDLFIFLLGLLLILSYLRSATVAYDDLFLPTHYANLTDAHGRLGAARMIFLGGDLTSEYRTYGLSRLAQYALWSFFGAVSLVYPLLIAMSQVGTAFLLLRCSQKAGVSETTSLTIASVWMMSPFAATWTFHHYSYLILPFQILIFGFFFFQRTAEFKHAYVVAFLLGFACALTGETQLPAAVALFLALILFSRFASCRKAAWISAFAFVLSLGLHRMNWSLFIREKNLPQRFAFQLPQFTLESFFANTWQTIQWIWISAMQQIHEITGDQLSLGVVVAVLVATGFLICVARGGSDVTVPRSADLYAASLVLTLAAMSISIYVVMATLLGPGSFSMSRRYGYIALPLISIFLAILLGEFFNLLTWPNFDGKRIGHAISIFCFAVLAGQFYTVTMPTQRGINNQLTAEVLRARENGERSGEKYKTALFFVANDEKYSAGLGDGSTIGPLTDTVQRRELFESIWGIYWTANLYAVNFLGFRDSGMTSHCRVSPLHSSNELLDCQSAGPIPFAARSVPSEDVVVIANLGLEKFDPAGDKIKVFSSYADFEPNDFGRRIDRSILDFTRSADGEFFIDLGQSTPYPASDKIVLDKKLSDPFDGRSSWIENYGFAQGENSVFKNPNIREELATYGTNRNGNFTYHVAFKETVNVEIGFDFWEQWGRSPGERLFNLEVSWDGKTWANVGTVDMAALNGNKPFSIILKKKSVRSFSFRTSSLDGTKDVPALQNVWLRQF